MRFTTIEIDSRRSYQPICHKKKRSEERFKTCKKNVETVCNPQVAPNRRSPLRGLPFYFEAFTNL